MEKYTFAYNHNIALPGSDPNDARLLSVSAPGEGVGSHPQWDVDSFFGCNPCSCNPCGAMQTLLTRHVASMHWTKVN